MTSFYFARTIPLSKIIMSKFSAINWISPDVNYIKKSMSFFIVYNMLGWEVFFEFLLLFFVGDCCWASFDFYCFLLIFLKDNLLRTMKWSKTLILLT